MVSLLLNPDPIVSTQWSGWRLEEDWDKEFIPESRGD